MIRINLLPAELEAAPTQINPVLPISVVAIVPFIFLIPFHLSQLAAKKKAQNEITSLKSELERYQPIIAQVEALEQAKSQLTQRKGVIQQLEAERLRYPQFMDDFVKLLPGNIWLTNMSTAIQPGGTAMIVNLDVIALDNYAVADLISNLETSQIFTDVDLGAISIAQSAPGTQSITFHVTTTYRKNTQVTDATKKS